MLEVAIVTGSPGHVNARTPAVPAARQRPLPPEVVTLRPPPTGLPGTVARTPRTRSSDALHHPGAGNLQLRRRRADLCVRGRPGTLADPCRIRGDLRPWPHPWCHGWHVAPGPRQDVVGCSAGMQRRSNAVGVSPRAARQRRRVCGTGRARSDRGGRSWRSGSGGGAGRRSR